MTDYEKDVLTQILEWTKRHDEKEIETQKLLSSHLAKCSAQHIFLDKKIEDSEALADEQRKEIKTISNRINWFLGVFVIVIPVIAGIAGTILTKLIG